MEETKFDAWYKEIQELAAAKHHRVYVMVTAETDVLQAKARIVFAPGAPLNLYDSLTWIHEYLNSEEATKRGNLNAQIEAKRKELNELANRMAKEINDLRNELEDLDDERVDEAINEANRALGPGADRDSIDPRLP